MYDRLWLFCALTLDHIDDHVCYIRRLLSHLWSGAHPSGAMEAAEGDVNAFMAERKRRLIADVEAASHKLVREIEEVWIPRDTRAAAEAPVDEVRRLLRECEMAVALRPDDARVCEALERWAEVVRQAAGERVGDQRHFPPGSGQ